jgi:phosphoribosylaminoimidazole-succinocarboxamide synthase
MGKAGQQIPLMSDERVSIIQERYIELYEKLIGEKFIPQKLSDEETFERIENDLEKLRRGN